MSLTRQSLIFNVSEKKTMKYKNVIGTLWCIISVLFVSGCFTRGYIDSSSTTGLQKWKVTDVRLDPKSGDVAVWGPLVDKEGQVGYILPAKTVRGFIHDGKEIRADQFNDTFHPEIRYFSGPLPRRFSVALTDTSTSTDRWKSTRRLSASALPGLIFTVPADFISLPVQIPYFTGHLKMGPQM